jgi:hypothetical protein
MTPSRRLALLLAALLAPGLARAQLGLDLTPPEPKKEKKGEKKAVPPRGAPARPVAPAAGADARPRLDAAKARLADGKAEEAALLFDAILRDPGLSGGHDEARYQLAKALATAGLRWSALSVFDEVLALGSTRTRYFHNALEWLFATGRALDNEQPVLSRVARFAREGAPPANQDRFHFFLAKYEFERGRALDEAGQKAEARAAWQEARRLSGLVRQDGGGAPPMSSVAGAPAEDLAALYARATFVDALAIYALGDEQAAAERFKDVVRLTDPRKGRAEDPELRELALLQLARIHYQSRQNRYAIWYYGRMPWGGREWLEGLWEASYAHYRIGQHEKTLGNLLTLQSAYFRDEYFPESWVLKAIVYYENCRYPEARRVLKDFTGAYEPLYDELVAVTARPPGPADYTDLAARARLRKLVLSDQNVRQLDQAVRGLDEEAGRGLARRGAAFRDSPLLGDLKGRLAREREQLVREAALRARGKLEYERDQLRAMLAQGLRIEIEVSRQEREALEGSLAAGSRVEVVKDLRWTHAVSDEQLYWPYEGEFWRDELGTYSYTLTRGCKGRPPRQADGQP